jgi:hypothetical protein
MFQKEMFLRWLHNLLDKIFKIKPYYDFEDVIDKGIIDPMGIEQIYDSETKEHIGYLYTKVYKDLSIQYVTIKREVKQKYFKWGTEVDKHSKILINSKWRNSEGVLYIGKPLYKCASCMPSIHSIPLLIILPLWKVVIIAAISVTIATLINDKIFE